MRNYKVWIILIMIVSFWGCERKIDLGVHEVHWDRDMCVRCKMVVSDRQYAAQTTDPTTGRAYYFDDIGCVVLWLEEDKIAWAERAIIWVTDVNSGEWINAREAKWSTISITPMAFGYAAHKAGSEPRSEIIDYDEMAKRAIILEAKKKKRY
ncbi:MAG TPA: hypothetical protein EYH01_10230 [Campylobacterales bacterium]|nr:hypothetical protein [Campylobacterales bacterium]